MRIRTLLALVAFAFLVVVAGCDDDDALNKSPQPNPALPPCTSTVVAYNLGMQYQGFGTKFVGDFIFLEKQIKSPDGQVVGHERHKFNFSSDNAGQCQVKEFEASREIGGSMLVNDFLNGISEFFQGGQLVYKDLAIKGDGWFREYIVPGRIQTKVPNWACRDKTDPYMTWIAMSDKTCSLVPVWGFEALWRGPADSPTLMGGRVIFKNPALDPTMDDLVTVLRFDASGTVNPDGVLFPVSAKTWKFYHAYQTGEAATWQRDLVGDKMAMEDFLVGPIRRSKIPQKALDSVYTKLPQVKQSFLPAFNAVPPLRR